MSNLVALNMMNVGFMQILKDEQETLLILFCLQLFYVHESAYQHS